jgi:hypothetical protein
MFPEDEADVVAYLNKQFYKFKPLLLEEAI